jgi:hypothetical protein
MVRLEVHQISEQDRRGTPDGQQNGPRRAGRPPRRQSAYETTTSGGLTKPLT